MRVVWRPTPTPIFSRIKVRKVILTIVPKVNLAAMPGMIFAMSLVATMPASPLKSLQVQSHLPPKVSQRSQLLQFPVRQAVRRRCATPNANAWRRCNSIAAIAATDAARHRAAEAAGATRISCAD
jgi:hypothetical protein